MNSHLNLFKSYSKFDREQQLENDLTRAFAICLQEDSLFFHEVLKEIMKTRKDLYDNLFDDFQGKSKLEIDVQRGVNSIAGFEHLFAVSLSEHQMDELTFFEKQHNREYDPITDLVIQLHEVAIIFEVKPNNQDCSAQLYNQSFNAVKNNDDITTLTKDSGVIPVDLNWFKLMGLAIKVMNFEHAVERPSRFLSDFIEVVGRHNYRWLPEAPIASLSSTDNAPKIEQRLRNAFQESELQILDNRLGLRFHRPWAHELLFKVNEKGDLVVAVYPGNTKGQGIPLFQNGATPEFKHSLSIMGKEYDVTTLYHLKFSGQSYITGLWFGDEGLRNQALYSAENFWRFAGRRRRGEDNWKDVQELFDNHFNKDYDWRKFANWEGKLINSNRKQFDLSFGYELTVSIPFDDYKEYDTNKNDLSQLIELIKDANEQFLGIVKS